MNMKSLKRKIFTFFVVCNVLVGTFLFCMMNINTKIYTSEVTEDYVPLISNRVKTKNLPLNKKYTANNHVTKSNGIDLVSKQKAWKNALNDTLQRHANLRKSRSTKVGLYLLRTKAVEDNQNITFHSRPPKMLYHTLPMVQQSNGTETNHQDSIITNYNKSTSHKQHVNIYPNNATIVDNSACIRLSNLYPEVHICIHDPQIDQWVSKTIGLGKFWEEYNVYFFQNILLRYPSLNVIDIGANIGQYTLIAAHLGRKVVAVEARLRHVHMIHHSVVLNNYQHLVTIVHNAVSDKRTTVDLGFFVTNQGATYIIENRERKIYEEPPDQYQGENTTVQSILLDDLALKGNFQQAILKIDIEGYELKALRHADKLFDKVYIPYIIMEWTGMIPKPEAEVEALLAWFKHRGYQPFTIEDKKLTNLDHSQWKTHWPSDIFLKHQSVVFNLFL